MSRNRTRVNPTGWDHVVNKVSRYANEVSSSIEVEVDRNNFTNLGDLTFHLDLLGSVVTRYTRETVFQEVENMRTAAKDMQERAEADRLQFSRPMI